MVRTWRVHSVDVMSEGSGLGRPIKLGRDWMDPVRPRKRKEQKRNPLTGQIRRLGLRPAE